jgi:hypothetical protein
VTVRVVVRGVASYRTQRVGAVPHALSASVSPSASNKNTTRFMFPPIMGSGFQPISHGQLFQRPSAPDFYFSALRFLFIMRRAG